MSSFAGVSMVIGGKARATPPFDVSTNGGYHLLVIKDYAQTVRETPNGRSIKSGPFMVGGHRWHIDYYPNGDDPSCADFLSLYACCLDHNDHTEAKIEFSFVDQVEHQKPLHIHATETFSFSKEEYHWGYTKFMKRDAHERSTHLKAGCFTIRCDIMVCKDLNTHDSDGTMSDIHQHFDHLLQNKVGADVTFEVGDKTFVAHRCVLAARSKVFMAQLFGPMMEGTTASAIQIKDMRAKVFVALLKFIYTDSLPDMDNDNYMEEEGQEEKEGQDEEDGQEEEEGQDEEEGQEEEEGQDEEDGQEEEEGQDEEDGQEEEERKEDEDDEEGQDEEGEDDIMYLQWLQDLLVAADRYDLQRLKFLCGKKLSEHIDVSSVASTLTLAEQHHCQVLKEACFKFIQVQSPRCLDKLMASDGWEHMSTAYPSLLKELIAKLVSNQKKKKRK